MPRVTGALPAITRATHNSAHATYAYRFLPRAAAASTCAALPERQLLPRGMRICNITLPRVLRYWRHLSLTSLRTGFTTTPGCLLLYTQRAVPILHLR